MLCYLTYDYAVLTYNYNQDEYLILQAFCYLVLIKF